MYVCMYLCKVCDERGRGAQPIMNDQETVLVVQKFNTRGLAFATIKLISFLCMESFPAAVKFLNPFAEGELNQ